MDAADTALLAARCIDQQAERMSARHRGAVIRALADCEALSISLDLAHSKLCNGLRALHNEQSLRMTKTASDLFALSIHKDALATVCLSPQQDVLAFVQHVHALDDEDTVSCSVCLY